jgi:uncharacterized protein YbjT (DUF2867 family)
MIVLVAGANGLTGKRIAHLLINRDHEVHTMIRDAAQAPPFEAMGAVSVVADLEGPLDTAVAGCNAVIFAAGAGSKTGPDKTISVDQEGAIRLIDACACASVRRFIMLSSIGANDPESEPEAIRHYMRAKGAADAHLAASGLDYTIVCPGILDDREPSGGVRLAPSIGEWGKIARNDVAEVIVACLNSPNTITKRFEIMAGKSNIERAVAAI